MNYLFVGEDEFSKDIKLARIKQELFLPQLESFNFEVLYSKEIDLKTLQEKLLSLPVNSVRNDYPEKQGASNGVNANKRLILLKDAPKLTPNIKEYLLSYLRKPFAHVCLILDSRGINKKDPFFNRVSGLVRIINFHESMQVNSFTLARQVLQRRGKPALKLLRQLLLQGERPERILGALRFQLHQEGANCADKKQKLLLLLNCDIDIKTGRLKPELALERLLISWCFS